MKQIKNTKNNLTLTIINQIDEEYYIVGDDFGSNYCVKLSELIEKYNYIYV